MTAEAPLRTSGRGAEPDIDQAHLRSWIGRIEEAEDVVTPRLVTEFRATLEFHLAPVAEGDAPLALHWCLAPPAAPAADLGPDGHPTRGGFLPPVPLPRRMWAGGLIETYAPLRVGDRVRRRSRIEDVAFKPGRSGRLCFVSVRHDYETSRGLALTERHDIVYRDAAAIRPAEPTERPPADLSWTIEPSPTLLFRYSALTFNGHRIHYDQPYATGVEGYAGLVVHGPLQATLLFNLATTLAGRAPARFAYRGLSPMTAGPPFTAGARRNEGAISCWTQDVAGRICMEGEART